MSFNRDQMDYMKDLGKLPPEEKCPSCGWYTLAEINGKFRQDRGTCPGCGWKSTVHDGPTESDNE